MKLDWDPEKRDDTLKERGLGFAIVADADWDDALTV